MELSKKQLRKQLAKSLCVSNESLVKQALAISNNIRSLAAYKHAKTVGCYMHMDGGEIPTDHILSMLFNDNKRVFLPMISNESDNINSKMLRMIEMNSLESIHKLEPRGKYKIREPLDGFDASTADGLDLLLVPGLGFSKKCERIGRGKGFYDSYIHFHGIKHDRTPTLVGICANEQLLDSIPCEEHDKLLDYVVTENKIYSRVIE